MPKITIDSIQTEITADGWKIISTDYKNLDTPLEFECREGHRVFAPYKKIRTRRECPVCGANTFTAMETNEKIIPKKSGSYRVLGVDQASRICGFAIFDNKNLVKFGIYNVPDGSEIERILAVKQWLISLIKNWGIDYVCLEGIQLQQNVAIFEVLAHLQGALMITLAEQKIAFQVCPVATWRAYSGVKGKTRADRKRSMQLIVKKLYDVSVSDDCADAIGIGRYASETITSQMKVENWE